MRKMNINVFPIVKSDIFKLLNDNDIYINDYCKKYIEHEKFNFSEIEEERKIIIMTLEEMGFTEPVTQPEIMNKAKELGYKLCEPSMGVYLRLVYRNQRNSNNSILRGQHKSPDDAIQIVSKLLESDFTFPRGLYIRKVDNKLWLRGYICDDEHEISIENEMAFELK
jgi:hypothetical protein